MVATLPQIIGKINPLLYAENGKSLLKEYGSAERIPAEKIIPKPVDSHTLGYDSTSETLEPIYFFILDLMNDFGLAPHQETEWNDLSNVKFPFKCFTWGYVDGEIMSPVDDAINPQRLINRILFFRVKSD